MLSRSNRTGLINVFDCVLVGQILPLYLISLKTKSALLYIQYEGYQYMDLYIVPKLNCCNLNFFLSLNAKLETFFNNK